MLFRIQRLWIIEQAMQERSIGITKFVSISKNMIIEKSHQDDKMDRIDQSSLFYGLK